jgi:hypothetical protein
MRREDEKGLKRMVRTQEVGKGERQNHKKNGNEDERRARKKGIAY